MGDEAIFIPDTGWYWVDPKHVPEEISEKITLDDLHGDLALIKFDIQLIREKLGI